MMMRPIFFRHGATFALLGIVAALAACGGGGGGSAATPPIAIGVTATPTPVATATPAPPAASATSSATVSVGSQPATATFAPIAAGISGTIGFPATSSGSATIATTLSANPPPGAPGAQSMKRRPAAYTGADGLVPRAYLTLTASASVAFNQTPTFTFTFAAPFNAPNAYLAAYDPANPSAGWTLVGGSGKATGSTVTFASVTAPLTLVAGRTYIYQVFSTPGPFTSANRVRFATTLGNVDVILRPDVAPLTVANFLRYVNRGAYTHSFIHRSVPGFVIQGGGYAVTTDASGQTQIQAIPQDPPVQNEFKLSNTRGTLAAAKLANDPNSATSQWYFNLTDNSANLDTQNSGYTVFGQIDPNDTVSLGVMDSIAGLKVINAGTPFDQLPVMNYSGGQVQTSNLVIVNQVGQIP